MPKYNLIIETRKEGSIGVFNEDTFTITANNVEEAREKALRSAHSVHGLETRFILSVKETEGK